MFSLSHLQNYHNHNSQQYVPNCERPEAEDQDLLEMLPSVAHPYGDILEVRVLECLEVSVLRAKLNLAKLNLKSRLIAENPGHGTVVRYVQSLSGTAFT